MIRADDLLTWMDHGRDEWQWGLKATSVQANPQTYEGDADLSVPTLKSTLLDFTDVNEEKGTQNRRTQCTWNWGGGTFIGGPALR